MITVKQGLMVVALVYAPILIYGYAHLALDFYQGYQEYQLRHKAEMKCVKRLIARGVERKNIFTGNGTCEYKENGYYHSTTKS